MKSSHRTIALWATLIALGMLLGAVIPGQFAWRESPPATALAKVTPHADVVNLNKAFVTVAAHVKPAVVNVSLRTVIPGYRLQDFLGRELPFRTQDREVGSLGSGAIIRNDGYIVTNNHVVRGLGVGGPPQITVTLADNRKFPAQVVGTDPTSDIAVLKIEAANLPTLEIGDSEKLQVGEWVMAIGSPVGLDQTVTAGIVSAKGRKGLSISSFEDFIQTDAAINHGNSGGPLVNIAGELVGINTAIAGDKDSGGRSEGIGFSVPANTVRSVTDALMKGGKIVRGWIGVASALVGLTDNSNGRQLRGMLVREVTPNSPAQKAGIVPGDVILSVDGRDVTDGVMLRSATMSARIGSMMKLRILRDGKTLEVLVKVEGAPIDANGVPRPGV